jgi:hypothetical protein
MSSKRDLQTRNVPRSTPAAAAIFIIVHAKHRYLGVIAVDLETGTLLRGPRPQLLGGPNSSAPVPQDPAVQQLVDKYKAPLEDLMTSVIGAPGHYIILHKHRALDIISQICLKQRNTGSDFVRATKSSATASICSNQVGRLCPWWAIEPSYGQTKQTLAATCAMPSCVGSRHRSPRNMMYQFA